MSKMVMDKQLSACETVIMKAVWDFEEDIPLQELMRILKEDYGRDYARTTITTFLTRLVGKGFIQTYRKGRVSYTHPLKTMAEYMNFMLEQEKQFWFDGDPARMIKALLDVKSLTAEERESVKKLLE